MGITHRQGKGGNAIINSSSVTTFTATWPSTPTPGNLLVGILFQNYFPTAPTALTIKDSAGTPNNYSITVGSPYLYTALSTDLWQVYMFYILSAPATITSSVVFHWTTQSNYVAYIEEFNVSGGTVTFDKEAGAQPSTQTVTTPAITPASAGSNVLYSGLIPDDAPTTTTGPTAGGTLGIWTGAAGGIESSGVGYSSDAEYTINASGSTGVNYTQSGSTQPGSLIMGFTFTPSGGPPTPPPNLVAIVDDYQWGGGPNN